MWMMECDLPICIELPGGNIRYRRFLDSTRSPSLLKLPFFCSIRSKSLAMFVCCDWLCIDAFPVNDKLTSYGCPPLASISLCCEIEFPFALFSCVSFVKKVTAPVHLRFTQFTFPFEEKPDCRSAFGADASLLFMLPFKLSAVININGDNTNGTNTKIINLRAENSTTLTKLERFNSASAGCLRAIITPNYNVAPPFFPFLLQNTFSVNFN